jgi:tRNA threonylcarbamoyladenosine biosynthesis protein TsaE
MDLRFSLSNIHSAALQLWQACGPGKVIALHGPMGAGKTTLVHAICDLLKVSGAVGSPTFSLINEYRFGDGQVIYHIDLYRLSGEEEAVRSGVEEVLYSGHTCFVEWPERAPGLFPTSTVHVYLEVVGDSERRCMLRAD